MHSPPPQRHPCCCCCCFSSVALSSSSSDFGLACLSPFQELAEARDIVRMIGRRDVYKCVGEFIVPQSQCPHFPTKVPLPSCRPAAETAAVIPDARPSFCFVLFFDFFLVTFGLPLFYYYYSIIIIIIIITPHAGLQ